MWLGHVLRAMYAVPAELPLETGLIEAHSSPATDVEDQPTDTGSVPMKRVWAMPNKWTFKIPPVKVILAKYDVGNGWLDPFAGFNSPAEYTNDLNPESPAKYHMAAHDFLSYMLGVNPGTEDTLWKGVLFDPPYSIHQVKVAYDSFGLSLKDNITGGFPKEKDLISQLVRPGGIVISFGWNTVGMGKKRGFEPVEYMAISHGGNRNDTLVSVERRV